MDEINPEKARAVIEKLKSFKKTLLFIKLAGNIAWIYLLLTKNYFNAFLVWLFFCPDIEQIIRFMRKFVMTIWITYRLTRIKQSFKP